MNGPFQRIAVLLLECWKLVRPILTSNPCVSEDHALRQTARHGRPRARFGASFYLETPLLMGFFLAASQFSILIQINARFLFT